MKKIFSIILVIICLVSYNNTIAQFGLNLGIKAGSNFSTLSFDPDIGQGRSKSSAMGGEFGGIISFDITSVLAIQVEPTYAQEGCSLNGPLFFDGVNIVNGKTSYNLEYLEIPILVKLKIPLPTTSLSPFVFLGPKIGKLLSSKEKDEPTGLASSEIDLKDYINSKNFSVEFGAGAEYKLVNNILISLDLRYSLGTENILTNKGEQYFGIMSQKIKTTGLQIVAEAIIQI